MAEKPQAKNELGQLFVDIGIGGLGKTLKGLNSVAATFLLGRNAAMQFAQTITKPFKEVGNGAVELNKMSKSLGTSTREFQRLYYYLKQFKSESLVGDIEKVMVAIQEFNGKGGTVPEGWAWVQGNINGGANKLFEDLTPDLEGALTFINRLKEGLANLDDNRKAWLLRDAGLSSDFMHLWQRGVNPGNYLSYSDKELDEQLKMQEAFEQLGVNFQIFAGKFFTKFAEPVTDFINKLSDTIFKFTDEGGLDKTTGALIEGGKAITPSSFGEAAINAIPVVGGVKYIRGAIRGIKNAGAATGGAAGISPDILNSAGLPGNLSSTTQSITNNITHDITINGDNANEIANQIAGLTAQDIQYTQYQAANLAGI